METSPEAMAEAAPHEAHGHGRLRGHYGDGHPRGVVHNNLMYKIGAISDRT